MLSEIMEASTLMIVIRQLSICGILWLTIWRSVSISLVYTDMISPVGVGVEILDGQRLHMG